MPDWEAYNAGRGGIAPPQGVGQFDRDYVQGQADRQQDIASGTPMVNPAAEAAHDAGFRLGVMARRHPLKYIAIFIVGIPVLAAAITFAVSSLNHRLSPTEDAAWVGLGVAAAFGGLMALIYVVLVFAYAWFFFLQGPIFGAVIGAIAGFALAFAEGNIGSQVTAKMIQFAIGGAIVGAVIQVPIFFTNIGRARRERQKQLNRR